MSKRFKAAVIGGSGYGANEIIRRLLIHPEVELVRVASIDYVGEPLGAAHPNLEGLTDLRFEDIPPEEAADGVDVVLLGLPHTVSSSFVPRLLKTGVKKIVDLSGDFRLKEVAAYEKFYKVTHPCPELLEDAVYGLPELNREAIAAARLVASPGCFATCTELGLLPLAQKGWLTGEARTLAITGSSGSGAAAKAGTHHPVRAVNLKTYKPLMHQHVPEIVETLNAAGAREFTLHFAPVSAPLTRGILASTFVTIPEAVTSEQIAEAYASAYADARFVRIPDGRLPEVAAVSGSMFAEVGFEYGPAVNGQRTVMCFSAIDNLIKGGAGQAVQSMNITLGLDEGLTLMDAGGLSVTTVIKLGGNAVGDGAAAVAADVARLVADGERVVLVHGGGPQTSALQKALGQTPRKVAGRRVTDEATLDAIKMVVGGKINVDLCAALLQAGAKPIGLHGASSCVLSAERRPPTKYVGHEEPVDLGFVGDVTGVNLSLISLLCDAGHVPVMACIGANERGEIYNINADVVAGKVAVLLEADALVMVSDIRSVLRDVSDPASRIASMTAAEGDAAIADGVVTEGMIPKIQEAFATIAAGVQRVIIAGQLAEGELLAAVREPGSVGTTLVP